MLMLSYFVLQRMIIVESYLISNSFSEFKLNLQVKYEVAQKLLQNSSSVEEEVNDDDHEASDQVTIKR